jgi:hypothetical protein
VRDHAHDFNAIKLMTPTRSYSRSSVSREDLIATINALLAAESGSLMQRLRESSAYVPPSAADEAFAVQELVDQDAQHAKKLVELLDRLRATPGPRRVMIDTGDLHYNRIHTLIPRLIADQKRLIAAYDSAQAPAAQDPQAADVVSALLASHRTHLAKLEQRTAAAINPPPSQGSVSDADR